MDAELQDPHQGDAVVGPAGSGIRAVAKGALPALRIDAQLEPLTCASRVPNSLAESGTGAALHGA